MWPPMLGPVSTTVPQGCAALDPADAPGAGSEGSIDAGGDHAVVRYGETPASIRSLDG